MSSIIYFKLAEITNGNELKNSKYGQNTGKKLPNFQTTYRLQMVSKIRYFWEGERKRFNLIPYMLRILIKASGVWLIVHEKVQKQRLKNN